MASTKKGVYYKEIDTGSEEFGRIWKERKGRSVKVGIVDLMPHDGSEGFSVADIAAVHEFGTDTIPERPFMRLTMIRNESAIKKLSWKLLKKVFTFRMSRKQALGLLGQFIKDKMVATIDSNLPPRTKEGGVMLIDTGQMRSSIDWEIDE